MNAAIASVEHVAAYAYAHGAERVSSRHDVYAYEEAEWVNGPHGVDREPYEMVVHSRDTIYEDVTARWAHGGIVEIRVADGCAVVDVDSGADGSLATSHVAAHWREVIEDIEEQGAAT